MEPNERTPVTSRDRQIAKDALRARRGPDARIDEDDVNWELWRMGFAVPGMEYPAEKEE